MRAGTGGSLVHTEERLQVEEQNDGRHDDVQRRKNGNWEVGWVFLQVIIQFARVVLHIVLPFHFCQFWGSLAGIAGIRSPIPPCLLTSYERFSI